MRWLSISSNAPGLKEQLTELWESVERFQEQPDVALVFFVAAVPEWYESLVRVLQYRFTQTVFAGCCAVAAASNVEGLYARRGVVVMLGWLPGVEVVGRVIRDEYDLPTEDEGPDAWHRVFGTPNPQLQLLFTVSHHKLPRLAFRGMDMAFPDTVRTGICGDGRYVFIGNEAIREGVACISLEGDLAAVMRSSDPWIRMGNPGIVTSLTDYGCIATIDHIPGYEFFRRQVTDIDILEDHECDLYLGVGNDLRLNQEVYEKLEIQHLSPESGEIGMEEIRVGQQVQLFYRGSAHMSRLSPPGQTEAVLVFTRFSDDRFRPTVHPFAGVQGRAAITNFEGFTGYEWGSRVGLFIQRGASGLKPPGDSL